MWEKGDGFRKAAATINRGASCVRAMLLNIVLAARNVKPPRSGKARGSFREIQALDILCNICPDPNTVTSYKVSMNKM